MRIIHPKNRLSQSLSRMQGHYHQQIWYPILKIIFSKAIVETESTAAIIIIASIKFKKGTR